MIDWKSAGNLFDEDAEALVIPVNCVGVMGRGAALQAKRRFPENFRAYADACRHGTVRPGEVFLFETNTLTNPRFILNFPTKQHWRDSARIEDIESGLADLVGKIAQHDIRSIAVPALGCGLGGLDWTKVRALMEEAFRFGADRRVILFELRGIARHPPSEKPEKPKEPEEPESSITR